MLENAARIAERKNLLEAISLKDNSNRPVDLSDGSNDIALFDCSTFMEFLNLVNFAIGFYIVDEDIKNATLVGLNLAGNLDWSTDFWERIEIASLELNPHAEDHGVVYNRWHRGICIVSELFDKQELELRIAENRAAPH